MNAFLPGSRRMLTLLLAMLFSYGISAQSRQGFASNSFVYTKSQSLSVGAAYFKVVATDHDGNGRPDLAAILRVPAWTDFNVSVYRNSSTVNSFFINPLSSMVGGELPADIVPADLNGDSKPDLIVTSGGNTAPAISVFENKTEGFNISFKPEVHFTTGNNPTAICVADLDADGKPDIVVINSTVNTFSVFKNTGTAGLISFAAKQDFVTANGPAGIAASDFNGDGKPELVVINSQTNTVSIYKNTSTSTEISFAEKEDFATNVNPVSVRIRDVDADGKPDMLVSNADNIRVFRNTSLSASYSFAAGTDLAMPDGVKDFAVADMDEDSIADLAVCGNGKIYIVKNISTPGNIHFDTAVNIAAPHAIENIIIVDMDGDRMGDLVGSGQNSMSIFQNLVNGPNITSFTPMAKRGDTVTIRGNHFTGTSAVSFGGIAAASFKVVSDTVLTAVIGIGASGSVKVTTPVCSRERDGFTYVPGPVITSFLPAKASFASRIVIRGSDLTATTSVSFGGVEARSFTVESDTTIVAFVGRGASGDVRVVTGSTSTSAAGFTYIAPDPPPVITSISPLSGPVGTVVTITGNYFNTKPVVFFGAGRGNVISSTINQIKVSVPPGASYEPVTVSTGSVSVRSTQAFNITFSGADTATFKPFSIFTATRTPWNLVVCDFNEDGRSDVITSGDYISVMRNASKNWGVDFDKRIDYEIANGLVSNVAYADLDGDGRPDVAGTTNGLCVFQNASSPANVIALVNRQNIAVHADAKVIVLTMGDLDDDGKPEILVVSDWGQSINIFQNTSFGGAISFAPDIEFKIGQTPRDIVVQDIDGDGKKDVVVPGSNEDVITVFRNISVEDTIRFAPKVTFATPYQPYAVAVGDLNGDGKPEMIVTCGGTNGNVITVYRNSSTPGNVAFDENTDVGAGSCKVGLGDMNGDGKPDIVAGSDGEQVILFKNITNNGAVAFAPGARFTTNGHPSSICLSDVNGDGKADIITSSEVFNRVAVLLNNSGDAVPIIDHFSPLAASADSFVNIYGSGFNGATGVTFGGVSAKDFEVLSDTLIKARVDSGSSGIINVYTPAGMTALAGFTFIQGAPQITSVYPLSGTINDVISIKGRYFTNASAVRFGGVSAKSFTVVSDTLITAKVGLGASGAVKIYTPYDSAFITGFTFIPPAVPLITFFAPKSATTEGTVIINGMFYTGVTEVLFGGKPAKSFTVENGTVIRAVVGNGASGSITVSNANGAGSMDGFTYVAPHPQIALVTPAAAGKGDTVKITGKYFGDVIQVTFGGIPATSLTITDTTILAVVGTGASGDLMLTTKQGYLVIRPRGFQFINTTPVISFFVPETATKGDVVKIFGDNFNGATAVLFGGVPALSFKVDSAKGITAVVGDGATGTISVITAKGTATKNFFVYTPPPYIPPVPGITSFTPTSATIYDAVKIRGNNFTDVTGVYFGGVPASFSIDSATGITAYIGEGASGEVRVVSAGGTATLAGFTYIPPTPRILYFTPDSAVAGTRVKIIGDNLSGVTRVLFGGEPAASFVIDSVNSITAIVGNGATGPVTLLTAGNTASKAGFVFISPKEVTVYPNPPVNGKIYVKHPSTTKSASITVVDMNGMMVRKVDVFPGTGQTELDLGGLLSGLYQVTWSDGEQKQGQRIFIP